MALDKLVEQFMHECTKQTLAKIFIAMLNKTKDAGSEILAEMLPASSPEQRQQILNAAWETALSDVQANGASKVNSNDWLADSSLASHLDGSSELTMTKEEFFALDDEGEVYHKERAEQSILNKYGYSVSRDSHLSSKQRQELLSHLISTHVVSKRYVISHLEHLIAINGKKQTNDVAVAKWKADLAYVCKMI